MSSLDRQDRRTARLCGQVVIVGVGLALALTPVCAQPVVGRIESLGFPVTAGTGAVIRVGQWFPMHVQLAVQGSGTFAREIRFEGRDLDGDRIAFVQPPVTLSSEGGAKQRRVWCYAAVNSVNEMPPTLDVLDDQGASVAKLPLPTVDWMSNDDELVLDISDQPIVLLNRLITPAWSPGQRSDVLRDHYRNIVVSKMRAADLPERWWGLEAVDVIVWDQPSPADLGNIAQMDALMQWVRTGGQLIIGVGASWDAIRRSDLRDIMPLVGEAPVVDVRQFDNLRARAALPTWSSRQLERPVPVTTAGLATDTGAVRVLTERGPSGILNLITMRLVGSGRVVATAASLKDLTSLPVDEQKLFGALLDLNSYTPDFKKNQSNVLQAAITPKELFDDVVEPINFGTETALRGLAAFVFVGAYIVLATIASWHWLRRRRLAYLNWTVFAGFAVAASALSLLTVTGLRGFARGVRSVTVADLEAGTTTARGPCWFGYRSPLRQTASLSLPGDENFLRPLARGGARTADFYVTPARYAGYPAKSKLDDVLMRATLKQVEGYWHGDLEGTIRGDLVVSRRTGQLTPASWIANELPVALDGACLLFIDPRQDDGGVPRAAGLYTLYDKPAQPAVVPPSMNVLVVRVPGIAAGQRVADLGAESYAAVADRYKTWKASKGKRPDMPDLGTLWDEQMSWRTFGSPLPPGVRGLLLASTRDLHLHNRNRDFNSVDAVLSSEGLTRLDICHWLLPGQAILLAWSGTPGPARLHLDGQPQKAHDGLTFYRVRLPLRYEGNPSAGEGTEP